MCFVDIPHFKEILIMSMVCDGCGYRSNEIKGCGAIPRLGRRITLAVTSQDDLSREVVKSDTAGVLVPELGLELKEGGLEGIYTTVEGLLGKMLERLRFADPFTEENTNGSKTGLYQSPAHKKYMELLQKLQDMASGIHLPFTIIVSDPLANSFIGPLPTTATALALQAERDGHTACYDDYVDSALMLDEFERTEEQNETLGLNDIETENYQSPKASDKAPRNDGCSANREYYGTDAMSDVPGHLANLHIRGPDHPH